LKSSAIRRPSGENIGEWKFRFSGVAGRMLPSRPISTSDRGSSGMDATVPLRAAANCAVLLPPMATPLAMITGAR
jgi:hypothetical protein